MWLSGEDARSDFVLAVAATVLGRFAFSLVANVPLYPSGLIGSLLTLLWLVALTGLAPYLLARYRRDVPAAFGMGPKDRGTVVAGVVVAAPLVLAHLVPFALAGDLGGMVSGLFGRLAIGSIDAIPFFSIDGIINLVAVVILLVGTWLFTTFVAVRSRDAFRSPDTDVTETLRTFGMAGIGATVLLGLLRSLANITLTNALVLSATLVAVMLLTDRYVPPRLTATRASLLAPAIAIVVLHVLAAGGLFRGDLLTGLHHGAGAGVITLCVAALLEAKQGWAATLLILASVLYPVPVFPEILSPLPLLV
jgi:hypothetical protein